jgi:uncharacterized membrane protein YeaQ/YmgE (transglycosylase-associated protein family)
MPLVTLLIQMIVGALAGIFYLKVMKKPMFGQFWGAIIFGVIGGILGAYFLGTININNQSITQSLIKNPLSVDFLATIFGSFALLWLFSKISH